MSRPKLPDADFLASLSTNPAYKGIDIERELARMDAWLALPKNAKRIRSRAFIINWLNKVDVAVEGAVDQPRMNPTNRATANRFLARQPDLEPRQRFVRVVTTLAAVFRIEVDDLLLEAYWVALRRWPAEALEAGARQSIATLHFFPRPVEWAEAAEAWLKAKAEVERRKRRALPHSTDPPLKLAEVRVLIRDLAQKLAL